MEYCVDCGLQILDGRCGCEDSGMSISLSFTTGYDDGINTDISGLVCPKCFECKMANKNLIDEKELQFRSNEEKVKARRNQQQWRSSSTHLWHGIDSRKERYWKFNCTNCLGEFSMGEIYDAPFNSNEIEFGLPEIFLKSREEVVEEIRESNESVREYFIKNKAFEMMQYGNHCGRNYIKAKRWYDDIQSLYSPFYSISMYQKFLEIGIPEKESRLLEISQVFDRDSSVPELRGEGKKDWVNLINLTSEKIAKICHINTQKSLEIFQLLELMRIKKAYSSRYWVIDESNPNHIYEPDLFTPSPVKQIDINKIKDLEEYEKDDAFEKSHTSNSWRNHIMKKFGHLDIFINSHINDRELVENGIFVVEPDFIKDIERMWRKIGPQKKKTFPEDAKRWYRKYHTLRTPPLLNRK